MKILYIESKLKNNLINLPETEIAKLPKKLDLLYSIQYKELAESVKKQLELNNIKISKFNQILGCSEISSNNPVLFIGSGRFHALNIYLQAKDIFILENNKIIKIPEEEIEKLKNRRKAAYLNFLNAKNIGILVSTKRGQSNINKAFELKNNLKDKKCYIFLSNNIDINQFENFNIDSWINTACPGLAYDNPKIINYKDIIEFK